MNLINQVIDVHILGLRRADHVYLLRYIGAEFRRCCQLDCALDRIINQLKAFEVDFQLRGNGALTDGDDDRAVHESERVRQCHINITPAVLDTAKRVAAVGSQLLLSIVSHVCRVLK